MGKGFLLSWLLAGLLAAPPAADGKEARTMGELQISSPAFDHGGAIPSTIHTVWRVTYGERLEAILLLS